MLFGLQATAAVFLGIAGVVSMVRHAKSKSNGDRFNGFGFLFAACVFGYLAISHFL